MEYWYGGVPPLAVSVMLPGLVPITGTVTMFTTSSVFCNMVITVSKEHPLRSVALTVYVPAARFRNTPESATEETILPGNSL